MKRKSLVGIVLSTMIVGLLIGVVEGYNLGKHFNEPVKIENVNKYGRQILRVENRNFMENKEKWFYEQPDSSYEGPYTQVQ
jgi:hypothetical protein